MTLESAICPFLRSERTLPRATPANYVPPFPVVSARFDQGLTEVAMVLIGAQAATDNSSLDYDTLDDVTRFLESGVALPEHRILCASTDPRSLRETRAWKAWWSSRQSYEDWALSSGFKTWFASTNREGEGVGWFVEAIFPTMDRFETVFSNASSPEGAAMLSSYMSGEIEEHGYWGSARDRLAVAQHDALLAAPSPTSCPAMRKGSSLRNLAGQRADTSELRPRATYLSTRRVLVAGPQNLCVIHSGQDWSHMTGQDRDLYLGTLHPVLQTGMKFLALQKYNQSNRESEEESSDTARDSYGCYDCRFMRQLDPTVLEPTLSKTFGLAYFDSLASLERWSREHRTHLNIFHGFFSYAKETQGKGDLRLFHEISVLKPDQQHYEYVNFPTTPFGLYGGGV